jgi:flagellar protein FlbD
MITVTRLNGSKVTVNVLFIETVEQTPDTVISLTTGNKIVVRETADEVIEKTRAYLSSIGIVQATVKSLDTEG